jgi:hypothetical protein
MTDLLHRRGIDVPTPEQQEERDRHATLNRTLRTDPMAGLEQVRAGVRAGDLTREQAQLMVRHSQENPLSTRFKELTADEALDVFNRGTDAERVLWHPVLAQKATTWYASGKRDPAQVAAFREALTGHEYQAALERARAARARP